MSFWCWRTQLVLTKLIFDHTERRPTESNFFKNIYLLLVCGSQRETWVSLLLPLWGSWGLNPGCVVGSKCLYPMSHFVSPNCSIGFGIMGRQILLLGVLLQGRSLCKPHCQHRGLRWSSASGDYGQLWGEENGVVDIPTPPKLRCVFILRAGLACPAMASETISEVTPACSGSHSKIGPASTFVRPWNGLYLTQRRGRTLGWEDWKLFCFAKLHVWRLCRQNNGSLKTHVPECRRMASSDTRLASS